MNRFKSNALCLGLGILVWIPALPSYGLEVFAELEGITVGEKQITFDSEITIEADCREVGHLRPLPSPYAKARLDCRKIGDFPLPEKTVVRIYAFGDESEKLELNQKYQITGRLNDALTFGGRTSLHIEVKNFTALGPIAPIAKVEEKIAVDLKSKIGEQVDLYGTLGSLNGVWWFSRGDERIILATERGRSRTFETDWHGRQVTVSGLLKHQLRASPDQISLKTARDLKRTFVVFDSKVALADKSIQENDTERFGVLYDEPVKRVDGVFDLIPKRGFRRNLIGSETDSRLFVERNWRFIQDTIANAKPPELDVVAARMNDSKRELPLRFIYAGILAARNDPRGQEFLADHILKSPTPDVNAMYVLGAFAAWTTEANAPVDLAWAERPAIHCLKNSPSEMQRVSNILPGVLLELDSKEGIERAIAMVISPPPQKTEPIAVLFAESNISRSLASDLLGRGEDSPLSSEVLIRFAKALPDEKVDYVHRRIAETLFKRDEVAAVELYLPRIAETFWFGYIKRSAGPKCMAEIKRVAPDLELNAEARKEVDRLMITTLDDPAAEYLRRINHPDTSLDDSWTLIWDLMDLDPPGWETEVSVFVKNRLLIESSSAEEVQDFPLDRLIKSMGESDDPDAVEALISLFDCDFEKTRNQWTTPAGLRGHIAAQLAEMTGESFGDDPAAWQKYLQSKK